MVTDVRGGAPSVKSTVHGSTVERTTNPSYRNWVVVLAGHSFVRGLKAAHVGGSKNPTRFVDTSEEQASLLAKKLHVTSKVKQVFTCAAGVTTFESLESKVGIIKRLNPNMVVVHCLSNDLAKLPSGATPERIELLVARTLEFAKQFPTDVSVVFLAVVPRYDKIKSQPWEFREYAGIANVKMWTYADSARRGSDPSVPSNYHVGKMQGWWHNASLDRIPEYYREDGVHPAKPGEKYSKSVRKAILKYGNTPDGV